MCGFTYAILSTTRVCTQIIMTRRVGSSPSNATLLLWVLVLLCCATYSAAGVSCEGIYYDEVTHNNHCLLKFSVIVSHKN